MIDEIGDVPEYVSGDELTPLSKLPASDFAEALETHKASGLAKLYNVTVSTIHYYKDKHAGKKRPPSIAQLEARAEALKNRPATAAARGSAKSAEAEAAKAAKAAARVEARAAMDARRAELLAQIELLKAGPAALAE